MRPFSASVCVFFLWEVQLVSVQFVLLRSCSGMSSATRWSLASRPELSESYIHSERIPLNKLDYLTVRS